MPERDGYIPGVPSWVDTSQPDPGAALPFYSGLFGWEFENAMPEGSEGSYFIGRIRGGDVAAVGSIPDGAPPMAMWNTYIWVDSADDTAAQARAAGGGVPAQAAGQGSPGDGHGRARSAERRTRRLRPTQPPVGVGRLGRLAGLGVAVRRVGRA